MLTGGNVMFSRHKRKVKAGAVILGILFVFLSCAKKAPDDRFTDMKALLPAPDEYFLWTPVADAYQAAKGENLYDLINGGADLYLEYGFDRAVFTAYESLGLSVNLELYRMESDSAAFGIYSLKKGSRGKPVSIGQEAALGEYYLNVWQGRYLITSIGMDSSAKTLQAVMQIARLVADKIPGGEKPVLAAYSAVSLYPENTVYLRGPAALFNIYSFGPGDIFGFMDAVYHTYEDGELFVFRYENESERTQGYQRAIENLENGGRFSDFSKTGTSISMMDEDGYTLQVMPSREYILVLRNRAEKKAEQDLRRLFERVLW